MPPTDKEPAGRRLAPPPAGKANRNLVREMITQTSRQQHQPNVAALLVQITALKPNPNQPRKVNNPEQDKQLADDIRTRGILEPLIVRPDPTGGPDTFQIVAGERRFRAAQTVGLNVVPVIVQELNDRDVQLISLAENLQRAELNEVDEANFFQMLSNEYNWSTYDIAKVINKSQSYVQRRFDLLKKGPANAEAAQDETTSVEKEASAGRNSEKGNNKVKNTQSLGFSQLERGFNRLAKSLATVDKEIVSSELKSPQKQKLVEQIDTLRQMLDELEKKLRK